ncbi:hypothetical protein GCM10027511_02970 [Hymenobacter humi]
MGLGALLGTGQCAAWQWMGYVRSASLYAHHANGTAARPWYSWMEWPQDVVLLGIYTLTGIVGAGLYYC